MMKRNRGHMMTGGNMRSIGNVQNGVGKMNRHDEEKKKMKE